jgi:hypothetical protein
MREFCTSGSVGTSGRKRPGVTRQPRFGKNGEYEMSRQGSGASRTDAHLAERHVF